MNENPIVKAIVSLFKSGRILKVWETLQNTDLLCCIGLNADKSIAYIDVHRTDRGGKKIDKATLWSDKFVSRHYFRPTVAKKPKPQYRILKNHEIIKVGDECSFKEEINYNGKEWNKVAQDSIGVGTKANWWPACKIRRRIHKKIS